MQIEKKGLKSKISLGFIILTPLCVFLYIAVAILKIFGEASYEILLKHIYAGLPLFFSAFIGLFLFFILALFLGSVYFSGKTRMSGIIDKFMLNVPLIKHFWHAQSFKEKSAMDLSKLRAVLIQLRPGIWQLVFFTGEQKTNWGRIYMKALLPTYPLPFTGWIYWLDEEKLAEEKSIIYLSNSSSELSQFYLSFGFLGPAVFLDQKKSN
ncbi:MAG: hypothetical protein Q8N42_00040 [bacterium]|nr:hypothetical protein [bacterium]